MISEFIISIVVYLKFKSVLVLPVKPFVICDLRKNSFSLVRSLFWSRSKKGSAIMSSTDLIFKGGGCDLLLNRWYSVTTLISCSKDMDSMSCEPPKTSVMIKWWWLTVLLSEELVELGGIVSIFSNMVHNIHKFLLFEVLHICRYIFVLKLSNY